MAFAVGKADDLVLDRGAVARTASGNRAGIDGGPVRVVAHDGMSRRGRAGDVAGDLRRRDRRGERGKRLGRIVAGLNLERAPVDARAIEARRRPGLQPAEREAGRVHAAGERDRRRVAEPAGRRPLIAEMDHAAQERAGREDERAAGEPAPVGEFERRDPAVAALEPARFRLDDGETWRGRDQPLHRPAIQPAVDLRARALHGRALAPVEDAELDSGGVGRDPDEAVERVDLAHEMTLAEPADRRIAGHRADRLEALRHEGGRGAEARRGGGGFAARMASADDDHVEPGHCRLSRRFAATGAPQPNRAAAVICQCTAARISRRGHPRRRSGRRSAPARAPRAADPRR